MSAENPVTEQEWDEWNRRQAFEQTQGRSGKLLKRELVAAQDNVLDLLQRVIHGGETVVITGDDGEPAAALIPYAKYRAASGAIE